MILRKLYYLRRIRDNPRKDLGSIREFQLRALKRIIRHAYETVPYYHELFARTGITPDDIRTLDDLSKIPVTDKQDLTEMGDLMLSSKAKLEACRVRYTSGSTGNPHRLVFDRSSDDYGHAADMRCLFENGYSFSKRLLEVTHPRHITGITFMQRLGLHRHRLVSIFEAPERILKEIRNYRPHFIKAYPSVLRMLAEAADERIPGLERIFTTSEILTAADRRRICSRLGADIIDLYGSVEFPRIAWECEKHRGYHIDMDSVIVELTRDGKPVRSGSGDITVTGLNNMAMPLIRYRIGDIGNFRKNDSCTCGRTFRLMGSISGRCNDRIVLPSGREVDPIALYSAESLMGIRSFRITQESRGRFVVEYVEGSRKVKGVAKAFRKSISKAAGKEKVRIIVRCVKEIQRDSSGKFRCVVSKVNGPACRGRR